MIHIFPLNDIDKHTESSTCKCGPRIEEEAGEMLCIHNSFNGREAVENAKKILSERKR